jgi:anti-anti-sigma factor
LSNGFRPLEMDELRERGRLRLALRGELDYATADLVGERLRRLCEQGAAVVLDLDDLAFIDAAGLRVVLVAAEEARKDGWAFTVTRGSAPVRRLFEVLGIDPLMPFDEEPA